jgi:methylenetetrahydrofolate dehydrogenase (NADP+) / methenyltetrahydrofolate cyclohydrolase
VTLIDGRPLAAAIREQAAADVAALAGQGVTPKLATVVATDDPATAWYVRSIAKAAEQVGISMGEVTLGGAAPDVTGALDDLSGHHHDVHGIICLTPLPGGLTLAEAGEHVAPAKDVDGANPSSLGRLAAGLPAFAPATAQAVVEILRHHGTPLSGAEAVVVGRSTVVGKPLALLLLAEHATVTICHSRTRDLAAVTGRADVLVAAVGNPHLIGRGHVKEGAVVIDVGTNETGDGGLVGDVDTGAVEPVAGGVTPVPGGVGPVTTAVLLRNVVTAARSAAGRDR